MNRFAIATPRSFDEAATLLGDDSYSLPILKAGGMDVVDHLKEGLVEPDLLINIRTTRSSRQALKIVVTTTPPELRIEATTTLTELNESSLVRNSATALADAAGSAATPQVRNVATAAGNLLQRPRCWYYRNAPFDCLKKGGHQCFAVDGENAYHAIFGDGPCHIVHPSNLAPAFYVMNGMVHVIGGDREHIPITELYHMPDRGIRDEHNLHSTEVVTHLTLDLTRHSGFYAIKHKQSFDWPLAMAAAALELDGSIIRSAKICAGAVAPVPWPLPQVEKLLAGVDVDDDTSLERACLRSADGATPLSDNSYKTKLLGVGVFRAVKKAAGRSFEALS